MEIFSLVAPWMKIISIMILNFFSFALVAQSSDFVIQFNPTKDEGYFQGWNFSFQSNETTMFVTFLVSNLGPGSLNHGIAVFFDDPNFGKFFKTYEYASKELTAKPGYFGQKSRDSFMVLDKNVYHIHIQTHDLNLELEFFPKINYNLLLSNGPIALPYPNGFLRADIGFPLSKARARFQYNGKDYYYNGYGGMEHLNTNVPVYKYSTRWEIHRSYSKTGEGLFFGGYTGVQKHGYHRVLYMDKEGKTIWSSEVEGETELQKIKNKDSGYEIPKKRMLFLKNQKDCKIYLNQSKELGTIDILMNVSPILKFFIQIFFAKPYQIHYISEAILICTGKKDTDFRGLHSFYLIN